MTLNQKEAQHLYLRAGFGVTSKEQLEKQLNRKSIVESIFRKSTANIPLTALNNPIKGKEASNAKIALLILRSKGQIKSLNLEWLNKMAVEDSQLREKMTLFWHGHFASKVPFAYLMQVQNNMFRKHALGSFRDMLHAIAKDPAMLIFLNNQQNIKKQPNENFARELLELFTLGEGNYSEKDIKEIARAFTGWKVNRAGEFQLVENEHDNEHKTIFGKTKNFNGNDVIDLILENPKTAEFITRKIYKYLVNYKVDEQKVEKLSDTFYKSDYNITVLLRSIFESDWFYNDENIGSKICSPIELIVRIKRLFTLEMKDEEVWLKAQNVLGQMLFNPPNVAGWAGDKNWIDSSSLMLRLNLAPLVFEYDLRKWNVKNSDWNELLSPFEKLEGKEMIEAVQDVLLQTVDENKIALVESQIKNQKDIKGAVIRTMMLPEFQMV